MIDLAWEGLERADGEECTMLRRVFYPSGYAFPFHRHDFHELVVVLSGGGFHDTHRGSAALRPGDVVAVRPEQTHRCRAGTTALVFANLVLGPAAAAAAAAALAAVPGWDRPGAPPVLRPGAGDAAALLDHLAELERPGGGADRLAALALVVDLAWRRARADRAAGPARPGPVARMLAALDDAGALAGGAAAIAARAGCSREHLTRLARRHLGRPLATLVAERRLELAAGMLRQGEADVGAVCRASGHGNLGHFYARFRRRFGCTPGEFRARVPRGPA